ncbi:hypothetical protein TNCT_329721 [Trichonephila clavata]|uniref:Uncharacterized protein n=1 Tax=Trichonephila clavata TaxID=2740835 RepID=A0A8X6EZP9_TRICU|nr:hypothetical protein TNCT_329721 [Trichonephila clavata]
MCFQLALSPDAPPLGLLVDADNLLYFYIVDIASLLVRKNGRMFAKRFPYDIIFGNNVLPPTQRYPKQTACAHMVTRNAALRIIRREHFKLAEKFSNALDTGYSLCAG